MKKLNLVQITFILMMIYGTPKTKQQRRKLFMMAMTLTDFVRHPKVVMKFPGKHPKNIVKGQTIHDKTKVSTWMAGVPTLVALLAAYQIAINGYAAAEAKAKIGTTDDKTARDTYAKNFIQITSERIREIVQSVCDSDYEHALEIAQSCDMSLKGFGGKDAQGWSLKNGQVSGSVEITGTVKDYKNVRHSFQWQRTMDPTNAESWYLFSNEIIGTTDANTIVYGLEKTKIVYFRYRVITPNGATNWSETLSIVVQ